MPVDVYACPICGRDVQTDVSPTECCGARNLRGTCDSCDLLITYTGHYEGCPFAKVERDDRDEAEI